MKLRQKAPPILMVALGVLLLGLPRSTNSVPGRNAHDGVKAKT